MLKYRDASYFNTNDVYLFDNGLGQVKNSYATFDKGFWWLDDFWKATSVKCKKVK